ncbi:MAG: HD domain-containing protein [Clostridia bacterium]|nr:HD domain-containing protein [Clostridia bacterium]
MSQKMTPHQRRVLSTLCLILGGILLNCALSLLCTALGWPLYLDCLGTAIVAVTGGMFPAIVTGFVSNMALGFAGTANLYYSVVSALFAVAFSWLWRRGMFKKVPRALLSTLAVALLCGLVSAVVSWAIFGLSVAEDAAQGLGLRLLARMSAASAGERPGVPVFFANLTAHVLIDLFDKTLVIAATVGIARLLPDRWKRAFRPADLAEQTDVRVRRSLLAKVVAVVVTAELLLGTLACLIGYFLYRNIAIRKYTEICRGVTDSAALFIDAEKVDDYLTTGRSAPGYDETEQKLYGLRDSFPQVEYLYAYRIARDENGDPMICVVFDLDTEEVEAGEVGDFFEPDESFDDDLPTLLAGGEIDPIITDDTYGWLLTVYRPIYAADGRCVCYVAADVSMSDVITDEVAFLARMISLFFGTSILIVGAVIELVRVGTVQPINAMARTAQEFVHDSDGDGDIRDGLDRFEALGVRTGDEIENLYRSLSQMARDTVRYVDEVKKQNELITRMQEEIIIDFAEMVEARDKCTGDHIKKTSLYVEAIARELRRRGAFPEVLDDDYVDRLIRSAPLHDVGKIKISDLILNKPGRLTDEEFSLMKTHTTEGKEILDHSSSLAQSSGYLKEAIEMAYFHHERWDGKGYPCGVAGEQIPLSARIMAVADVFDALVSRRSYKQPFSYEQALAIIREESGTHFDPAVVDAFLAIAADVYLPPDPPTQNDVPAGDAPAKQAPAAPSAPAESAPEPPPPAADAPAFP